MPQPQISVDHQIDEALFQRFQKALERNKHLDADTLLSRALNAYLSEMGA